MPSQTRPLERFAQQAGQWSRRVRVQSKQARELLDALRTPEGRRRHLGPLLMLSGAAGALVGLAIGWRRHRRQ